jgi:hypothetical protein
VMERIYVELYGSRDAEAVHLKHRRNPRRRHRTPPRTTSSSDPPPPGEGK